MLDTINNLFTAQERRQLNALTDVAIATQNKPGGGTAGGVFIKLKQSGAISQLAGVALLGAGRATGDPTTTLAGTGFLILPAVAARLLLNPTSAKLLIEGMRISPASPRAPGLAARLMSFIVKADRDVKGKEEIRKQVIRLAGKSSQLEKTIWELSEKLNIDNDIRNQLLESFSDRVNYLITRYCPHVTHSGLPLRLLDTT